MIKIEKTEVWGFEHAIRGMRNPLNSWDRSDTIYGTYYGQDDNGADIVTSEGFTLGKNDRDLMVRLIKGGQPHRKFLRQIFVSVDITAPLYWWKEFDTYKVGTTANSCSTMHKLTSRDLCMDDFSREHLIARSEDCLHDTIELINAYRHDYFQLQKNKDTSGDLKMLWWQMIQLLPTSYNQKRTVTMSYENILNMLEYRRGHKLDEWRTFCEWIFTLPYGDLLKEGVSE